MRIWNGTEEIETINDKYYIGTKVEVDEHEAIWAGPFDTMNEAYDSPAMVSTASKVCLVKESKLFDGDIEVDTNLNPVAEEPTEQE